MRQSHHAGSVLTRYIKNINNDVQLCGIAWLHPEVPFCTQTGLLLLKRTFAGRDNSIEVRA